MGEERLRRTRLDPPGSQASHPFPRADPAGKPPPRTKRRHGQPENGWQSPLSSSWSCPVRAGSTDLVSPSGPGPRRPRSRPCRLAGVQSRAAGPSARPSAVLGRASFGPVQPLPPWRHRPASAASPASTRRVRWTGRSRFDVPPVPCARRISVRTSGHGALGSPCSAGRPDPLRPTCARAARPTFRKPRSADPPSASRRCPKAARWNRRVTSWAGSRNGSVMSRLTKPRSSTIKRLFALSGNRCAFPGCTAPLVDEEGCVIGEICHIHASRPDGPRHDAQQSDVARHGFGNLLLLCNPHHKRVDRHWKRYSVAVLLDMKRQHEQRFAHQPEPATDDIVRQLLEKLPPSVQVVGNGNMVVTGGSNIFGLSYNDVRQIAQDTAIGRIDEFTRSFLADFMRLVGDRSTLCEPDMQHALLTAQRAAARNASRDFSATLLDLLIDRAKSQNNDLMRVVLNEALTVAPQLTPDQFDALSLLLAVRYVKDNRVKTLADFRGHIDRVVSPFLNGASRTTARYQHLQYTGCAAMAGISFSICDIYAHKYMHLFAADLPEPHVLALFRHSDELLGKLMGKLFDRTGTEGTLMLLPIDSEYIPALLARFGADMPLANSVLSYLREHTTSHLQRTRLSDIHPDLDLLNALWTPYGSSYTLTSVGIALGHANMRRRGIVDYELSTWIN